MQGFAEDISAKWKTLHLIRMGEQASAYGADWRYPVLCGSNDGVTGYLFGLAAEGAPPLETARCALRIAKGLGYARVLWDRARPEGFHPVDVKLGSGAARDSLQPVNPRRLP